MLRQLVRLCRVPGEEDLVAATRFCWKAAKEIVLLVSSARISATSARSRFTDYYE